MDAEGIERTLRACEDALAQGGRVELTRLGFWKAVSAVKRTPGAPQRYGERIAAIDREAFLRSAPIAIPAGAGFALEVVGTLAAAAVMVAAPVLPEPWREVAWIASAGALIGSTHALTHFAVGTFMGMRFTHFFSIPPLRAQPGFKVDYASYLRVPARSRAWMHASGAIVSKVIPFYVAGIAALGGAQPWAIGVLLGLGAVQLVTDVTLSTKASDWKKFKREMRFAG